MRPSSFTIIGGDRSALPVQIIDLSSLLNLIEKGIDDKILSEKLEALNEAIKKDDKHIILEDEKLDKLFQILEDSKFKSGSKRCLVEMFNILMNNKNAFSDKTLGLLYKYVLDTLSATSLSLTDFEVCVAALHKILNYKDNDSFFIPESKLDTLACQLIDNFKREAKRELVNLLLKCKKSSFNFSESAVKALSLYFSTIKKPIQERHNDVSLGDKEYGDNIAKLLNDQAQLCSESIDLKELEEFIKLFGGNSQLQELTNEREVLEQEIEKLSILLHDTAAENPDYQNAFNQRDNINYLYQAFDITTIQNELLAAYRDRLTIYEPIGDSSDMDQFLERLISSVSSNKAALCIYNLSDAHWVTFAVLKEDNGGLLVLYKDSLGNDNPVLEKKIRRISQVTFISNKHQEQTEGIDCGIFALKNTEIIAQQLTQNREQFIKQFEDFREFCNLKSAREFRKNDFANKYVAGIAQQMAIQGSDIQIKELLESLYIGHDHADKICALVDEQCGAITIIGKESLELEKTRAHEQLDQFKQRLYQITPEINELQDKLDSLKVINIDNLIVLFGNKLKTEAKVGKDVEVPVEVIDKVIEIGKNTHHREVAQSVLDILAINKSSKKDDRLANVFSNIIAKIDLTKHQNIAAIKKLAEALDYPAALVEGLNHIVLESLDDELRNKAVSILNSWQQEQPNKFTESAKRTIKFVNEVEKNFSEDKEGSCLIGLIKEMAEKNEKLPAYFLENFKQTLLNRNSAASFFSFSFFSFSFFSAPFFSVQNSPKRLVKITKALVKGSYLELKDIANITNWLDSKELCSDTLKIIKKAIRQETIDDKILLDKLREISAHNKVAEGIINSLDRAANKQLGVLMNPRAEPTKRYEVITKIQEDKTHHVPYVFSSLAKIVKYEPALSKQAFKTLIEILPDGYNQDSLKLDSNSIAEASIQDIITLAKKNQTADLSLFSTALIQKIIWQDCSAKDVIDAIEEIPAIKEEIGKYIPTEIWEEIKQGRELIIDIKFNGSQIEQFQEALVPGESESPTDLLCRKVLAGTYNEEGTDEFELYDFIQAVNSLNSIILDSKEMVTKVLFEELVNIQKHYEAKYNYRFSLQDINEALTKLQLDLSSEPTLDIQVRLIINKALHCRYVRGVLEEKFGKAAIEEQVLIRLSTKLANLLDCNWINDSLDQLVEVINKDNINYMLDALDPIYEYGLREYEIDERGQDLISILTNQAYAPKWQKQVHDLTIFQIFKGSYDKNLEQLKVEITELNKSVQISILQNDKLINEYEEVIKVYEEQYKNWTESDIKSWSDKIKANPSAANLYEKVAVAKRAVELTSKFPLRSVQLLSLLIMLNPDSDKGRLAQINTGEGKTTIAAMLAAIKALEGHKVDIVTSSPELARPQSEEQSKFFEKFGLTTAHNGEDSKDIKERYKADIVYGAANNFQGDILRDEYSKLGILSGRKCDIAIVDEVDSMLIDGRNHIVMLSSPMPAMDHLEPLLAAIWIQIGQAASSIMEQGGKSYYVEQEDIIGEDGKVVVNGTSKAYLLEGTKEQFIKDCTEKHLRKMLRDKEHLSYEDQDIPAEYPEIQIPNHLREFVSKVQLVKWIDSAITAKYKYEENKQYILDKEEGKILPVDASNTGVVQQNMHWSNGLHQFLQIKHGTKITAESLTTNFISNVAYFRRYGSNIYGLTGTLGSEKARELLNKTYNVDSIIIPPFRKKQYQELVPIITNTVGDWYENIVDNSLNKLKNGRGVLVITKYMEEVDEIKKRLIAKGYDESKIKIYKTGDDSEITEQELKAGEIIIATNIAGRGTDIKPSAQIEKNGGLHLCFTFMPPNERVELQGFGRTSRSGNKGTGQFILFEKNATDINILKEARDRSEEEGLKIAEAEIEKTLIKDQVFAEFCKLLDQIDKEGKRKDDPLIKLQIKTVEDRFAVWLRMEEAKKAEDKKLVLSHFQEFKDRILDDSAGDKLVINPYFHVLKGNQLLENALYAKENISYNDSIFIDKDSNIASIEKHISKEKSSKENILEDAIREFTKAIDKDPHFAANAYYNRGYARIARYCGEKNWLGEKYDEYDLEVKLAIEDFKEAKRIIEENLEPMLNIIQKASYSEVLSEQVQHKLTLFETQKNAIESAIGIGEKGMKAIRADEERKLNVRINTSAIERKKQELTILKLSNDEVDKQIAEFEKGLKPTQAQRDELIEKDIIDSIRAEKIAALEASINERIKTNCRRGDGGPVDPDSYHQQETREDIEEERDALNNFKAGQSPTDDNEKRFYKKFQPTSEDIHKRKKELKKQESILEHGVIGHTYKKKRALEIEFIGVKKSLPEDQDASLYKEEIEEYKNNGFKGAIQVKEIKPIDWASVAGLAAIGLAQILVGAALAVFTCGAGVTIGLGLISEGISDIITAVKDGIINRDFDWESYGIQKAISLTVSIACAGLGAIKDVAKTSVAGAKAVAGAIKAGNIAMTQMTKDGVKLASKAVGTSIAKSVAKEIVTDLVDYGVNKALMPSIRQEVMKRIEQPIQEALLKNQNIQKMLELDGKNRNSYYQSLIKKKALELLNPQGEKDHALLIITKGIAKGIANSKVKGLSQAMQIAEAIQALNELNHFVPKFIDQLNTEVEALAKKEQVNEKLEKLKKGDSEDKKGHRTGQKHTTKRSQSRGHTSQSYEPTNDGEDIDHTKDCRSEKQASLSRESKTPEELKRVLSSSISVNMCNIIQSKLITPLTHAGIDYGVGKLTKGIDESIQKEIGTYQARRREVFRCSGDKGDRVPEEQWPSEGAEQQAREKAIKITEDLENGGEAGLPHLGALSDKTGRPIAVYDKKGRLEYVIGEDKGGEPVKVEYHKNQDGSGHYTLPGGKEAPVSGGNNCLFDVVAAQTGQNGQELRQATVVHMKENITSLMHRTADITRLETYKKDYLVQGGARRKNTGKPPNQVVPAEKAEYELEEHVKMRIDHTMEIADVVHEELKKGNAITKVGSAVYQNGHGYNRENMLDNSSYNKLDQTNSSLITPVSFNVNNTAAAHTVGVHIEMQTGGAKLTGLLSRTNLLPAHINSWGPEQVIDRMQIKLFQSLQNPKNHQLFQSNPKEYLRENFMKPLVGEIEANEIVGGSLNARRNLGTNAQSIHRRADFDRTIGMIMSKALSNNDKPQQGLNVPLLACTKEISPSFYEYTMEGIRDILGLRISAEASTSRLSTSLILPGTHIFSEKYNNIHALLFYLGLYIINVMLHRNRNGMNRVNQPVILAPLSLHGKHAVGVMFVAQDDGSGYKAFYLDPENTTMPEGLATIFKDNGYQIEQLPTEGQRYTNCGPEVIENFMLYLTGERLSQEDAIVNNSRLVEQELLSYGSVTEEANCLTLKDSYSKQDAVTVISNVMVDTQVSSDGYIIGNPTRYDIVTPQSIVEGTIVSADLGTEPRDVLLELVHDYGINHDYTEAILGEVASIDIS